MKIIGLNSEYDVHSKKINSGSCALIVDGKIEFALAEDRISRNKDEGGFSKSLEHILKQSACPIEDIDFFYISFYGNSVIPKENIVAKHLKMFGLEDSPEKLVVVPSHHLSHAYAAYFLSPFNEAVIMVADNEGSLLFPSDETKHELEETNCERNSYYWARGNNIALIERDFDNPGEVGFGKAYNIVNYYIGLGSYLQVGKTMGLSSYGKLDGNFENADLWLIDEYGRLWSRITETKDLIEDLDRFLKKNDIHLPKRNGTKLYDLPEYRNLAHFVQFQLNKWARTKLKYLMKKVGVSNVCVSGGVGLNGIMNNAIEKDLGVSIFVPPYPSDPGQALGNAIYGYVQKTGMSANSCIKKIGFGDFTYLGTEYSNEEIGKQLEKCKDKFHITYEYLDDISVRTANLLASGMIVAWFQGRSEYGARALGNRSILADPNSIEIRDRVNTLKRRELFRPLAPSVLDEYADQYFSGGESLLDEYMLSVKVANNDRVDKMRGVVHVDGTSRIQKVKRGSNPRYHKLISDFFSLTGVPMVMNTSFNMAGQPIVETPFDAVENFVEMKLDYLVCGNYLVRVFD